MQKIILVFLFAAFGTALTAQSPIGVWKTIDDDTGEAKSHVQVYEDNGHLYGKVVRLLKSSPDRKCDKCPGERKNQPVMNMVILEKMKQKGGEWQSGRILDPEKGKWYTCSFWLKEGDPNVLVVRGYWGPFYRTPNVLVVRGYWGPFYRTQYWYRT